MIRKLLFIVMICVSFLNADFIRNEEDKVLIDTKTGLIWTDLEVDIKTWKEALNYCYDLEISSYDQWKIPNYNELYSLVILDKNNIKISDIFVNKSDNRYWTSTVKYDDLNNSIQRAWTISFSSGHDNDVNIDDIFKSEIRCVHK